MDPVPDALSFDRLREIYAQVCDLPLTERERFLAQVGLSEPEVERAIRALLASKEGTASESDPMARAGRAAAALARELIIRDAPMPSMSGLESHTVEASSYPEVRGYRIIRVIGEGGMGMVYEAEQRHPKRPVALKVIRPGCMSPALLRRFEREVDLLGPLEHPGIARIYETGFTDKSAHHPSQPFFAMELVRGQRLDEWARQAKPSLRQKLEVLIKICEAVQHAHDKGVVHRDLKPSNIVVGSDGQPKILDFGVACAMGSDVQAITAYTHTGQIIGTLEYMSPEQANGDVHAIDSRSDVYALGAIAFELLAARLPYTVKDRSILEAARIIQDEEPARLGSIDRSFRGDVETIVDKALAKERDRRYATASDLAADLRAYLNVQPIKARPPSAWYQLKKFAKRNKEIASAVASLFIVLVVGLVFATVLNVRLSAAQRHVVAEKEKLLLRIAFDEWEKGDPAMALPWLVEAAALDPESDEHRLRIGTTVEQTSRLRKVKRLPGRVCDLRGDRALMLVKDAKSTFDHLEVIDVSSGATIAGPIALSAFSDGASFSPDGERIAVGDWSGRLSIWDANLTRQAASVICEARSDPGITQVVFSPDGSKVLAGQMCGAAWIFHSATGSVLHRVSVVDGSLNAVAWSPDGEYFATGHWSAEDGVGLWNARSGNRRDDIRLRGVPCVVLGFSPDGTKVAMGSHEGDCSILNVSDGKILWQAKRHTGRVTSIAFIDDQHVLTTSADGTARLWNAGDGKEILPPLHHPAGVYNAVSRGASILTQDEAGVLRLWDPPRPHGLKLLDSDLTSARFASTGIIAATTRSKSIQDFDASTGDPLYTPIDAAEGQITRGGRDGRHAVWKRKGVDLAIVELSTGRSKSLPGVPSHALELFGPDGATVYCAWAVKGRGGEVVAQRFDILSGAPLTPVMPTGVFQSQNLICDPTGRFVSVAGWDNGAPQNHSRGRVILLDAITLEPRSAPMIHEHGRAYSVDFHPSKNLLVTNCSDGGVRLWDTAGNKIKDLAKHKEECFSARFSSDGSKVVSHAKDRSMFVLDLQGNHLIAPLRNARGDPKFVAGDRYISSGYHSEAPESHEQLWDAASGAPLVPPAQHERCFRYTSFSADSRQAIVEIDGDFGIAELPRDKRSIDDLRTLAELFSCQRFDDRGTAMPLSSDEWTRRWEKLSSPFPE